MKVSKIIARLNELVKDVGEDIDLHFAIDLGDFIPGERPFTFCDVEFPMDFDVSWSENQAFIVMEKEN